jgi:DASS family divalent anion:Na+ symporter
MLKGSGVTEGGATVFTSAPQEQKQSQKWQGAKLLPSLLVLTVASVFWIMAPPEGLTAQTWHLMIIFLATIIAVILKPLPIGAISLIAKTLCVST